MKSHRGVCIITGGSGFLGKQICLTMVQQGFEVVSLDVNPPIDKISQVKYFNCDISDYNDLQKVFLDNEIEGKDIEVLINNAAIDAKYSKGVSTASDFLCDTFDSIIDEFRVSIVGSLQCTQLVAQNMISSKLKNKSIIFIGSDLSVISPKQEIYIDTSGIQTFKKPISYSLIKHAVVGAMKYLSTDLAKYNIRVNCVSPGPIMRDQPGFLLQNLQNEIPMSRLASISDVLGVLEFFCNDTSSYITGQNILVDGGRSVW
jgi:NAD(P)-dependent dehydrogenase (short-subunit alcohol dehydrogenase family)